MNSEHLATRFHKSIFWIQKAFGKEQCYKGSYWLVNHLVARWRGGAVVRWCSG